MSAAIVSRSDTAFTIQIEVPYRSSMLDAEETIQQRLNEAGTLATAEALRRFDTDGSPILVADTKLTSKGKLLKEYQTPPTVSPPSSVTSTRALRAAGPIAHSTATPASSAVPPQCSPRWSRSSTPSSARRG